MNRNRLLGMVVVSGVAVPALSIAGVAAATAATAQPPAIVAGSLLVVAMLGLGMSLGRAQYVTVDRSDPRGGRTGRPEQSRGDWWTVTPVALQRHALLYFAGLFPLAVGWLLWVA